MRSIDILIKEHEAMDAMTANLLAITSSPNPDTANAYDVLRTLARHLDNHFAAQATFLYADPKRADKTELDEKVIAYTASFVQLNSEWATYIAEWNEENIEIDWETFAQATQQIVTNMRARIRERNEELYPLALQETRIRLRRAA